MGLQQTKERTLSDTERNRCWFEHFGSEADQLEDIINRSLVPIANKLLIKNYRVGGQCSRIIGRLLIFSHRIRQKKNKKVPVLVKIAKKKAQSKKLCPKKKTQ